MLSSGWLDRIGVIGQTRPAVKSAIVNCVCPECGGCLAMIGDQFRCRGRCCVDWRPVWDRILAAEKKEARLPARNPRIRVQRMPANRRALVDASVVRKSAISPGGIAVFNRGRHRPEAATIWTAA
jgi:hypothetical protein